MSDLRFYAACLASYNAGTLHGAWIDASDDVDAMAADIATMLLASPFPNVTVEHPETGESVPSAEEFAIHDYDGIPSSLGEYPSLQSIADYVELIEAAEERGLESDVVAAVVSHFCGDVAEAKDAIEDKYHGAFDSLTDYAADYVESADMLHGVPDTIARYFDFESFGRDLELGGDIYTIRVDGTLHVFSGH
jgi:antirestriction protein